MIEFTIPDQVPPVAEGDLHIWAIPTGGDRGGPAVAAGVLASDELERARRYRYDLHRRRFVARRAALRELLGAYVGESPANLRFMYGPQGKPALASPAASRGGTTQRISFNLSHCEDQAVFVVSCDARLGVDLEQVREIPERERIAERFFAPTESAVFAATPPAEHAAAFFRIWTCKEALLKATGSGLGRPLDSFVVDVHSPRQPRVLAADGDDPEVWNLYPFTLPGDFVGTIALRGGPRTVRGWYYEQQSPPDTPGFRDDQRH